MQITFNLLSCLVESQDPAGGRKVGLSGSTGVLKVYCILSNAEIECSPDQKAVQKIVIVTDD